MYSSAGTNLEQHQRLLQKTEKALHGASSKYQHPFSLVRTGSTPITNSSSSARTGGSGLGLVPLISHKKNLTKNTVGHQK